jgi:hypothetical protein
MGLKTTNYIIKSTGLFLPNAYAKFHSIERGNNNAIRAIFKVSQSREDLDKYEPIATVEVTFVWDGKSNVIEKAYEMAKTQVRKVFDRKLRAVVDEQGALYGWEDDIVDIVEE